MLNAKQKSASQDGLRTGLSDDVTSRMIDHLRNATTDMAPSDMRVPAANFVSAAHAEKERALFRRLPLIVATRSELPEPGSFLTKTVLGTSVLIIRQDDGKPAAFLNMCRHRGGKVEWEEAGNKRVFVCRYHGWSYERDGALRGVPYEAFFDPIDRACNGLVPVRTEERHGFIWIDFSNDASRSVESFLGPEADAQIASFGLDQAIVFLEHKLPLEINWKLVLDGAIDILHPQFLHPDGVGKLVHGNAGVWKDYGRHGQLFSARRKLYKLVKAGGPIEAAWKYFATNLIIYPNSFIITAPDHVEFWTLWPDEKSPDRCTAHIRFLVRPEILTEEMKARLNKSWEILREAATNEDFPMEAAIQQNAKSRPDSMFVYGRNEISCQHLHRELRKDIGDAEVEQAATV